MPGRIRPTFLSSNQQCVARSSVFLSFAPFRSARNFRFRRFSLFSACLPAFLACFPSDSYWKSWYVVAVVRRWFCSLVFILVSASVNCPSFATTPLSALSLFCTHNYSGSTCSFHCVHHEGFASNDYSVTATCTADGTWIFNGSCADSGKQYHVDVADFVHLLWFSALSVCFALYCMWYCVAFVELHSMRVGFHFVQWHLLSALLSVYLFSTRCLSWYATKLSHSAWS